MNIKRHFTKEKIHPFDEINWITTNAEISPNFKQKDVIFPDFWTQTAINFCSDKYFCGPIDKNIEEYDLNQREHSLKQLVSRIVNTITAYGISEGYFGEECKNVINFNEIFKNRNIYTFYEDYLLKFKEDLKLARIFNDELTYMMIHQYFGFNSPVWFNVGNPYRNGKFTSSACFIVSAEDTIENIGENALTEMQIFRYGSGAGSNRSNLRSSYETINGGGKSSGPISFMKIYDAVASATKSGGLTRRAAKLNCLNIDHGDIEKFITAKSEEEKKAKILIEAGYSSDFDSSSGAYSSVFFQNSNHSVTTFDSFMNLLLHLSEEIPWALIERYPQKIKLENLEYSFTTSQGLFYKLGDKFYLKKSENDSNFYLVIKFLDKKKLFKKITDEAWETGCPGLQFYDIINFWNTAADLEPINSSNPCGEYLFVDDTSCNLATLKITKFYDIDTETFSEKDFVHCVNIGILAQDILVSNSTYPTKKITKKTKEFRTLGLNYSDFASLLMIKGIPYESEEAYDFAANITALMHFAAYKQSSEIAKVMGAFPKWNDISNSMRKVLSQHVDALKIIKNPIFNFNKYLPDLDKDIYRNAQVTVLAPTGTIGLILDCHTFSQEPAFLLRSLKKVVGGGRIILTLPSFEQGLKTLKYTETEIKAISEYLLANNTIIDAPFLNKKHYSVFATAIGDNIISVDGHLNMMAHQQPFLSGGISKTVNVPNDFTKEDIYDLYIKAWQLGLKSITVFRDGCKFTQPMNSIEKKESKNSPNDSKEMDIITKRKKLPKTRKGEIHKFDIAGHEGYLIFGMYPDNKPGELFIEISKEGSPISGIYDVWATTLSIALQYGVPIEIFIEKFKNTKFEPNGITSDPVIRFCTSIPDYISQFIERVLLDVPPESNVLPKEYNNNHNDIIGLCPKKDCGGMLITTGGCFVCSNCGTSTGCS
jgi:ribonucleoside-diphosphate reductase alpha chain